VLSGRSFVGDSKYQQYFESPTEFRPELESLGTRLPLNVDDNTVTPGQQLLLLV
jgi:hypothetical protein